MQEKIYKIPELSIGNKNNNKLYKNNIRNSVKKIRQMGNRLSNNLNKASQEVAGLASSAKSNISNIYSNTRRNLTNIRKGISSKFKNNLKNGGKKTITKKRIYYGKKFKGGRNLNDEVKAKEALVENHVLLNSLDKNGLFDNLKHINDGLGDTLKNIKQQLLALNDSSKNYDMNGGKSRKKGKKRSKKIKKVILTKSKKKSKKIYGGEPQELLNKEIQTSDSKNYQEMGNKKDSFYDEGENPVQNQQIENREEDESKYPNEKLPNKSYRVSNDCGILESLLGKCKTEKQEKYTQELKEQKQCIQKCKNKTEGGTRKKKLKKNRNKI